MKQFLTLLLAVFFSISFAKAQKSDKIFVNLYTDSLRKGSYNYINVDGFVNGHYYPMDSTEIIFWADEGKFYGNSLLLDKNFKKDKVLIRITLKKNPKVVEELIMYIKKKPDEPLKTEKELMDELKKGKKK